MSDKDIKNWDQRLKDQNDRGWDNYLRRRIHLDNERDLECWGICGEFLYVEQVSSENAIGSLCLNRNTNDMIDLELGTIIKTIFTKIFLTHAALQGEWIDIIYGINFEYYKRRGRPFTLPVPVQVADNGGSLTVDGAVMVQEPLSVDDNGGSLTVDGAVTIQEPLSVDDGGGSLTVDGAVTIQEPLSVDDNGGSLTVDGEVTMVDNGIAQPAIIITNGAADANTVGAAHACKRVLIRAFTTNTGLVWLDFGAAAVENACYPLDTGDAISVPLTNTNLINCLFKVANEKVTVIYTN